MSSISPPKGESRFLIAGGSVLVMLAALMPVIDTWGKLIHTGLEAKGIRQATLWQKIRALLHDSLPFGAVTVFERKRLFVIESAQQPLVS